MSIEKLSTNASLKQVMDKFEEISLLDLSNIDIVVLNELPTEVKEGQIVVISEKQPKNILFDFYYPTTSVEGDIFVKLFSTKDGAKNFYVGNDSKKISIYLFGVEQYVDGSYKGATSYIGENGEWVSMNSYYIVNSIDKLDISSYYTTGSSSAMVGNYPAVALSITNYALKLSKPRNGSNYVEKGWFTLKNPIDLNGYSTFYIDLKGQYTSATSSEKFIIQILSGSTTISSKTIGCRDIFGTTEKNYSLSMDVASINQEVQVKFMLQTQNTESIEVTVERAYFN